MKDRALNKAECEFCHHHFFLDQLVRMTMNYPNSETDVFDEVLCEPCLEYMRAHYYAIAPQLHRYYRSP